MNKIIVVVANNNECIESLKKAGDSYDYLVLLQPTQPLRKPFHIDEAIEKMLELEAESLVSVSKVKEHPVLIRTIGEDGKLQNLLNCSSTVRRQDFPDFYRVNGAIYINKIDENLNETTSLNDNIIPYEMAHEYDVDIDELLDLKIAELMLEDN